DREKKEIPPELEPPPGEEGERQRRRYGGGHKNEGQFFNLSFSAAGRSSPGAPFPSARAGRPTARAGRPAPTRPDPGGSSRGAFPGSRQSSNRPDKPIFSSLESISSPDRSGFAVEDTPSGSRTTRACCGGGSGRGGPPRRRGLSRGAASPARSRPSR